MRVDENLRKDKDASGKRRRTESVPTRFKRSGRGEDTASLCCVAWAKVGAGQVGLGPCMERERGNGLGPNCIL